MTARKKKRHYTVADIDSLRSAVRDIYLWGNANGPIMNRSSRSYKEAEMVKSVEESVRTYMLAGITGADLCAADRKRYEHGQAIAKKQLEEELARRKAEQPASEAAAKKLEQLKADADVLDCITIHRADGQYRCASCGAMQAPASISAYIPVGLQKSDSNEAFANAIEVNKWNGHSSAWCLKCLPKKHRPILASIKTGGSDWEAATTIAIIFSAVFALVTLGWAIIL
jgi:hypothetical protein